ncbi:ATP-binding protein [Calidifontibacillus erzurumensis]|uniref:ATP-binding protein n=1 Tax=Calidifontibacillus erzurumensis TaxID=2741433 RepID=UPI0035B51D91
MHIQSLHLYGFGKFENTVIEIDSSRPLAVFYGQNEAGKSTIMAFIHSIFFGFPPRNQSENRYEPKTGAKFGGKITLMLPDRQILTIERVAGRSGGEVAVYDEKGNVYGEEMLQSMFRGIDRNLYQAVFSFGMKGLQSIEKITASDLSHYLFAAGATGGETLFELEKKLSKKLEELYKPKGRSPLLNEKLTELEALRNQLKNWDGKIEQYNQLVAEKDELTKRAMELEEKTSELQRLVKEYEKKLILKPHVEERRKWQIKMKQIGDYEPFPVNGLERLRELQHELRPLKSQEQLLKEKMASLKEELQSMEVCKEILALEPKLRTLKEKEKLYETKLIEKEKIELSLKVEQKEIDSLFEKLGPNLSEEKIREVDTSLASKERLKQLTAKLDRLLEQKKLLDEQFNKAKADLELAEKTVETIKREYEKVRKNSLVVVVLMAAVIAALFSFSFMNDQTLLLIACIIVAGGFFIYQFMMNSGKNQKLVKEQTVFKQKEKMFEETVKQFEKWEVEYRRAEQELSAFCVNNHLPKNWSSSLIANAFDTIEELKRRIRAKEHLLQELNLLENAISAFVEEVKDLTEIFQIKVDSAPDALHRMMEIAEAEREKERQLSQLHSKREEYSEEESLLKQKILYIESEIRGLFSSAQVDDEDAFRWKGANYEEYLLVKGKLEELNSYLQSVLKAGEEHYIDDIENESLDYETMIEKIDEKIHEYTLELKRIHSRRAEVVLEIKNLEEGTAHSELVHRFEALKDEFQKNAKQWAVYKVAKDLIERTKSYYRKVRLPQVIETAQNYFSFLTFETYPIIYAPTEQNGFVVERNDGIRFMPQELSQATTEQLYLSLRLSLAHRFDTERALPLLIDDSFVNFDIERAKRAIQLIRNISEERQILFFTCHQHLVDLFNQEEMIPLQSTI